MSNLKTRRLAFVLPPPFPSTRKTRVEPARPNSQQSRVSRQAITPLFRDFARSFPPPSHTNPRGGTRRWHPHGFGPHTRPDPPFPILSFPVTYRPPPFRHDRADPVTLHIQPILSRRAVRARMFLHAVGRLHIQTWRLRVPRKDPWFRRYMLPACQLTRRAFTAVAVECCRVS